MNKLFSADVTPYCKYCSIGKPIADGEGILCEKRGVMLPDSSCKKFKYDPLKRMPSRQKAGEDYDELDFSLDEES